jgi:hypothetical protein
MEYEQLNNESKATLEGFKSAGFKKDYNYLSMKNDLEVSLDDFLDTIGFISKEVEESGIVWVNYSKIGVDFEINYNKEKRAKATVDFR